MEAPNPDVHRLLDHHRVPSPALLVFPALVRSNLQRLIEQTGSLDRLRPHVKTTKMGEVLRMMMDMGITKVKCATIAEAELSAQIGVSDILLAYQPVGPQIDRLLRLVSQYRATRFSTIVDCLDVVSALNQAAESAQITIPVYLDLDCGMQRSGIEPGPDAIAVYEALASAAFLSPAGMHVYDGHIRDSDPSEREAHCQRDLKSVWCFQQSLRAAGLPVPEIIAGGTPTFPIHARNPEVQCSPGTCVLWDAGYAHHFPDMNFEFAALLLTRVVSKPGGHRLCLDLGHKAVASEMPHPRVIFPALPDARPISHSEEHLVIETAQSSAFNVGDNLFGIPWHICPTVALHGEATIIENGRVSGVWKVAARERRLTL